jgi:DNA-binding protein HU-beta
MTKQELVNELAERTSVSRARAAETIEALFGDLGIVAGELRKGGRVQITGFGQFETRKRAARTGRDPRTGSTIAIGASVAPVFRPGKPLKEMLNRKR